MHQVTASTNPRTPLSPFHGFFHDSGPQGILPRERNNSIDREEGQGSAPHSQSPPQKNMMAIKEVLGNVQGPSHNIRKEKAVSGMLCLKLRDHATSHHSITTL
jgi:hypothetical protein